MLQNDYYLYRFELYVCQTVVLFSTLFLPESWLITGIFIPTLEHDVLVLYMRTPDVSDSRQAVVKHVNSPC